MIARVCNGFRNSPKEKNRKKHRLRNPPVNCSHTCRCHFVAGTQSEKDMLGNDTIE